MVFSCSCLSDEQRRHRRKNPYHVNPVYAEEAWLAHQRGLVALVPSQAGSRSAELLNKSNYLPCIKGYDKMEFTSKTDPTLLSHIWQFTTSWYMVVCPCVFCRLAAGLWCTMAWHLSPWEEPGTWSRPRNRSKRLSCSSTSWPTRTCPPSPSRKFVKARNKYPPEWRNKMIHVWSSSWASWQLDCCVSLHLCSWKLWRNCDGILQQI